ncbi:MAG: TonB-dependent receptor [Pseudomonadota bacterium]
MKDLVQRSSAVVICCLSPLASAMEHNEVMEEIVVTAPFQRTVAETTLPVTVLSGDALKEEVGNTLGESLANQPGITSAGFGSGVGRPVIRGQGGNRVQVMQNGSSSLDAAAISPDHANGIEAILARRVEVIRGPATLLYGNGAIGGVVNVIDNRIPATGVETPSVELEHRYNSVSRQNNTVASLQLPAGPLAIHLDGFRRESGNTKVRGPAIDTPALDLDAEALEELTNTEGYIANSDLEANGGALGASFVFDQGFIGYSLDVLNNEYGLPPGVHSHDHDDEHDDEHDDDHDHDDDHHDEHGEEDLLIRLVMKQSKHNLRGQFNFAGGLADTLDFQLTRTDYEHSELEISGDELPNVGTRFTNAGNEARVTLSHNPLFGWRGIVGVQAVNRTFSAVGEEAYIPRADIVTEGIFVVESFGGQDWTAELGARLENHEITTETGCRVEESATSLGASLVRQIDSGNLLFSAQRSQRAPTVEEHFSNVTGTDCLPPADSDDLVMHAATGLYEIGNVGLQRETANNLEVSYRRTGGVVTGEVTAYYNAIADYIYLDLGPDETASYRQQDATFSGLETSFSRAFEPRAGIVTEVTLFGDYVRATFDGGGNVPRIPPLRFGAGVSLVGQDFAVRLRATRAAAQADTAAGETSTDGYTLLDLYADYHFGDLLVFLKGHNLLNQEIRQHTSFIKSFAPQGGRGFEVGVRFTL